MMRLAAAFRQSLEFPRETEIREARRNLIPKNRSHHRTVRKDQTTDNLISPLATPQANCFKINQPNYANAPLVYAVGSDKCSDNGQSRTANTNRNAIKLRPKTFERIFPAASADRNFNTASQHYKTVATFCSYILDCCARHPEGTVNLRSFPISQFFDRVRETIQYEFVPYRRVYQNIMLLGLDRE